MVKAKSKGSNFLSLISSVQVKYTVSYNMNYFGSNKANANILISIAKDAFVFINSCVN